MGWNGTGWMYGVGGFIQCRIGRCSECKVDRKKEGERIKRVKREYGVGIVDTLAMISH